MRKVAVSFDGQSVRPMLEAMALDGWTFDVANINGGEIGLTVAPHDPLSRPDGRAQLIRLVDGDVIAISGLPLGFDLSTLTCAQDVRRMAQDADGAFVAVAWSAKQARLMVVTDPLGLQPGYHSTEKLLRLATELRVFPYEPNIAGWSAFFSAGHMIGSHTLTASAHRLGPGLYMEFGSDGRILEQHRTWEWPAAPAKPNPTDILDLFRRNVRLYHNICPDGVCLISGGADSRLLVGLLDEQGLLGRAYTLAHPGEDYDHDGKFAKRVAAAVNRQWTIEQPDPDFFSTRGYVDYLWASEGMTSSLYLFIARLYSRLTCPGIWDGLIPQLVLRTLGTTTEGLDAYVDEMMTPPGHPKWQKVKALFRPDVQQALEGSFHDLLARSRADLPDDPYGLWIWIVTNRMRNRTGINPFKVYANRTVPLVPGTSLELWRLGAGVPYAERVSGTYQLSLIEHYYPKLAKIPIVSGGVLHFPSRSSIEAPYWLARRKLLTFLDERPRLSKLLAIVPHIVNESRLFYADALWQEDDRLDMDRVRSLRRSGEFRSPEASALFHWWIAQWCHEGTLYKNLTPPHDEL